MATTTKDALDLGDILYNRNNVALARSQRLMQAWLPPKPQAQDQDSTLPTANEDNGDDDFRGDSEMGGIGSAAQKDDSGLPEGAFKRRTLGANDKLLDSLLGKKAANAHRKTLALAKSTAAQPLSAPKPAVEEKPKRPAQDSDSDDEGGRAAAFKSKRPRPSKPQPKVSEESAESIAGPHVADDDVKVDATEPSPEPTQQTTTTSKAGGKKRPASYLDELLGQKANKKNKKKKKGAATDSG